MHRKEWIEYFEAVNNRKPTIQECQQALLKGEFVMEEKQATFSSNSKSGTEEAISLPNQDWSITLLHSSLSLLNRKSLVRRLL